MLINTKTYNFDRQNSPDSASYAGPNHTASLQDTANLSRVYPKPVKDFEGVSRGTVDLTRQVIGADLKKRRIGFKLVSSCEVGVTTADIEAVLADLVSFAGSADGKAVFTKLDINA